MSAPPGFNPNASLLPDPGPSAAPIQVMRGGGPEGINSSASTASSGFTKQELEELTKYQLAPGGVIANDFDTSFKKEFLKQIADTSRCRRTTGDTIILGRDCESIVKVIRALLKAKVKTTNKNTPIPQIKSEEGVSQEGPNLSIVDVPEGPNGTIVEISKEAPEETVNGNTMRKMF